MPSPGQGTTQPLRFDPSEVDLHTGHHRFRFEPLDPAQRSLLLMADGGINGHPVDWVCLGDPHLDQALVAVRRNPENVGPAAWFHRDQNYREESFHSPFSIRPWLPDTRLARRLLHLVPAVFVLAPGDTPRYAFDVRQVTDARRMDQLMRQHRGEVEPASGHPWTHGADLDAIAVTLPFSGDRFARSTRKRFQLVAPGHRHDTTVEGAAARILRAHGFHVEQPRLIPALYRMLIGEPVAYWFRDPQSIERRGVETHHPPGANPLEALHRGHEAIHQILDGDAPQTIRRLGRTVVDKGRRPASYLHYTERLATVAERMGPGALGALMEGTLRGHRPDRADLLVMRDDGKDTFLVEVKSRGDRLRDTQMAAALWLRRDGRCGYRLMKVDHP